MPIFGRSLELAETSESTSVSLLPLSTPFHRASHICFVFDSVGRRARARESPGSHRDDTEQHVAPEGKVSKQWR
jgi:hypothetical protein